MSMNLLGFLFVDLGNSRIKWAVAGLPGLEPPFALYEKFPLPLVKGEMPTAAATPESIRALREHFPRHYLILSSVVPRLTPLFCRAFKRAVYLVAADSPALGLAFDYPKPAEIGADRLAAAVAVQADGIFPSIIVQCGTATAFSVLDAGGRFCGGVIAPGLQTQLAALMGNTAQLPETTLRQPQSVLARSTEEAIRAGVMLNFQGGAREILRQLIQSLPGQHPRIVLTGGYAPCLTPSLDLPHTLRPLLVFEGLRIIGDRVWSPAP